MSAITPGLHDFSYEFYSSDPCPQPSLDSRGIRTLLEASPAHFMAGHPRLTQWPDQLKLKQRDESLSAIVKCLVLNKGHEVAALPFDDWTTKQAQFQRRQAREDGKIPATRHVFDQATTIAGYAHDQLKGISTGSSDVTLVWRRAVQSEALRTIWCRERVDLLRGSSNALLVQVVGRAATDQEIAKAASDEALDLKAAWLLDGLYSLLPKGSTSMPAVSLATIETKPPYLTVVRHFSEAWLMDAHVRIATAVKGFVGGLVMKQWPYLSSSAPLEQPQRRGV